MRAVLGRGERPGHPLSVDRLWKQIDWNLVRESVERVLSFTNGRLKKIDGKNLEEGKESKEKLRRSLLGVMITNYWLELNHVATPSWMESWNTHFLAPIYKFFYCGAGGKRRMGVTIKEMSLCPREDLWKRLTVLRLQQVTNKYSFHKQSTRANGYLWLLLCGRRSKTRSTPTFAAIFRGWAKTQVGN